jgi:uncharacterized protein HemY
MSVLGYVTLTRQQWQEAEERMEGERASCVVRHAAPDYSAWWRQVDQQRARRRLRVVGGQDVEGRG